MKISKILDYLDNQLKTWKENKWEPWGVPPVPVYVPYVETMIKHIRDGEDMREYPTVYVVQNIDSGLVVEVFYHRPEAERFISETKSGEYVIIPFKAK